MSIFNNDSLVTGNVTYIDKNELTFKPEGSENIYSIKIKDPELAVIGKELLNKKLILKCNVKYDKDGNIVSMKNIKTIEEWTPNDIKIDGFHRGNDFVKFEEPLLVTVDNSSDDHCTAYYDPLGMRVKSKNYVGLTNDIDEWLEYTFDSIAREDDVKLNSQYIKVKYNFLRLLGLKQYKK